MTAPLLPKKFRKDQLKHWICVTDTGYEFIPGGMHVALTPEGLYAVLQEGQSDAGEGVTEVATYRPRFLSLNTVKRVSRAVFSEDEKHDAWDLYNSLIEEDDKYEDQYSQYEDNYGSDLDDEYEDLDDEERSYRGM